jgi:hypothetical protein
VNLKEGGMQSGLSLVHYHFFSSFVAILFARINVRPDIIILLRVGFAFLVH